MAEDGIRKEVRAHLISFMAKATERGEDGWKALEKAFPGIPTDVVAEVWLEVCDRETEKWWQSIERTIDGEIINNALTKAAP